MIAAHLGAVLARGEFDDRWRRRFLWVAALAGCAYVGMADVMLEATSAHARVFKGDMPWRVVTMATGGGWASVVLAPLVVVGAVVVLRGSRTTRGVALGLAVVLVGLWAGLQSAALEDRFFVWLVPGVAYLVGVAVGRFRAGAVIAAGSAVLAVTTVIPGYTQELTGYRAAAAVVRSVDAAGGRACIVGSTGLAPMLAYVDPVPRLHTGDRPVRPRRVRRGGGGRLVADECPMVLPGPLGDRRGRDPFRLPDGAARPIRPSSSPTAPFTPA